MAAEGTTREELAARGIAAMGRVARDEAGFTVYATGEMPDAFRVWEDPHAGRRCTCERFADAFARGEEYRCEHILAVALWLEPPADEVGPAGEAERPREGRRRIV